MRKRKVLISSLLITCICSMFVIVGLNSAMSAGPQQVKMALIGHRGASGDAPENTLESIKLAWQQGAAGAECDIMLTKDEKIVLMHDDTTKRTTGGDADLMVADTEWDKLKTLDVGSFKGPQWKNVKIPLLSDVLTAIPEGKKLFIEIKSGDKNEGANRKILTLLIDLLRQNGIKGNKIVLISFDHNILADFKKLAPEFQAYIITAFVDWPGDWPYLKTSSDLDKYISFAKANNIDGIDMENSNVITKEWVSRLHKSGIKSTIWSYEKDDTIENAKRFENIGIDYLTTNYPGNIKSQLERRRGQV